MSDDLMWYKDAIIYQLHVRAFSDSIGDGVGDFRGLASKLDYLQDLGVTAIWLLPFYPSPLRDDGYDIADYTNIHPQYGTLEAFQEFLEAAHERGLRVINELVINHTSDQHPWFQMARRAPPGSPERDFYVWSDTPEKYRDARIIFKDFEPSNWTYDNIAKAYFWHRFYSHQPDLNFDNPEVHKAIFPLLDFWMDMGIDGVRLDAIPYLYEREGTNCENLPETHEYLKSLRRHLDSKYPDRMFLAEANQWPEDAVAYFGDGDECHMAFHFPVMPRLFMGIHREDRFPIVDIMEQTPAIPENCQWAMFLRNHDELTLEMVTDEERDYMYRAYAHDTRARINLGIRRRLAPLLGNNRRRIELMNGLLFSLPGTPVIYYGDEIGMGDNIYLGDRNGVRTPMQWSADRNAGFSRANPQKLYLPIVIDPEYHYETINVEAQQNNPHSLLWWMKRLIGLRKRYKAFSRGKLEFLHPENRKILAFLRTYGDEHILVVANLSRFVQYVELDLSRYRGSVPVELFGSTSFPRVGRLPYLLTLGPHSFYWFALTPRAAADSRGVPQVQRKLIPTIAAGGGWEELFTRHEAELEAVLPGYIERSRWFESHPRTIKSARLREFFRLPTEPLAYLVAIDVEYGDGESAAYMIPMARAIEQRATDLLEYSTNDIIARLEGGQGGVLYDAFADNGFCTSLVNLVSTRTRLRGSEAGELFATNLPQFQTLRSRETVGVTPHGGDIKQTTAIICDGGRFALKPFRRIDEGMNPAWDTGRMLSSQTDFTHVAPLAGQIEYRRRSGDAASLAILHGFVQSEGDAWQFTLDALSDYFERIVTLGEAFPVPPADAWPSDWMSPEPPQLVEDLIGDYLDNIRLLGQRTAELHLALASDTQDPAFAPEGFSSLYQRSLYQSMRSLKINVFDALRRQMRKLPKSAQPAAQEVLRHDAEILRRFRLLVDKRVESARIRCHGNLHLGQILMTGKDFVFLDFEGSQGNSLSERRVKRSPIRDVATMLRSFHYATHTSLYGHGGGRLTPQAVVRDEDLARLQPWTRFWCAWVGAAYLKAYLDTAGQASFVPRRQEEMKILFDAYLLERALSELLHELKTRPAWSMVPLTGILDALTGSEGTAEGTNTEAASSVGSDPG